MRNDQERLLDILEAIEQIEKYAQQGRKEFEHSELIQTWMVHHIQLIGEAAARVSEDLRQTNPNIPWPQIIAMRNLLVHAYFNVDLDAVWVVVERDLPALKPMIESMLERQDG